MVLGRARGLPGDELEVVAGRGLDHGAADAPDAGIAFVALSAYAEEQAAVLVNPDVPVARPAKVQSMLSLRRTLDTPAGTVRRIGLPADQKAPVS